MIEEIVYICEICKNRSISEESIRRCEESHFKIDGAEIVYADYPQRTACPRSIKIRFQNGKVANYQFFAPARDPFEDDPEDEVRE